MPDGTGYSAINTIGYKITPEMRKFWHGWFASNDTHYNTRDGETHQKVPIHYYVVRAGTTMALPFNLDTEINLIIFDFSMF